MAIVSDPEPPSSRNAGSVGAPSPGTPTVPSDDAPVDSDERRLHELGYAQELLRGLGWFSNFAVSFTIISILTGILQTFYLGLDAGGPRTMVIDWLIGGVLILSVGLSMAEICSSYPTAGGLYYWSARLARRNAAAWSWFVGWINMLGQVALTASIDFGLAAFIAFFIKLAIAPTFAARPWQLLLIYAIVLAVHGALNSFGVRLVARLNDVSAWWHIGGTLLMVVLLFVLPTHHQSFGSIFTSYTNTTGLDWFVGSGLWITLVGLGLVAYTIQGFDASAHLSEETIGADRAGPRGIVTAITVSIIVGFPLLLALCWAMPGGVGSQEYSDIASQGTTAAAGVFLASMSQHVAEFLILIGIVGMFFCGMASVTANSRMIYAFSRDGAVPGHRLWHHINPRTRTPTNAIWFAVGFAFLLGVPSLVTNAAGVPVAFGAIVSVAVVSQTVAFVLPVYLRRRAGDTFQPGPWQLGRWSPFLNYLALGWTAVICLALLLPQFTLHSDGQFAWSAFNYAPIALAVVLGYATVSWFGWARKWFTGPQVQGTPDELAAIERELRAADGTPGT
jgi:amino acid transporter